MPVKRHRDEVPQRKPPYLQPGADDLAPVSADAVVAGEPIVESRLVGADLSGRKLAVFVAKNAILEGVSLSACDIPAARFQDVRLVKCDLSNAILRGFEARRVEFIDCRLIGMAATECQWQDVLVQNCDGRYVRLSDGRVRAGEFRASDFSEADFRGTDLEGASFAQVLLSRADLSHSRLRNADLRGAEIDGILVGSEDVRGAIVTAAQAMDLARLLGLVIK
jgi:uncharacterized protein YjbI with pentapeptide repeats